MADEPAKKPRGRPRLAADEPSVDVHFRLPAKQYDLTLKQATAARLSYADWMRHIIAARLRRP